MAVYVVTDFETVSVDEPHFENSWQGCFGYINTEYMKSVEDMEFFTAVILPGEKGWRSPQEKTLRFMDKHTPLARQWLAGGECPYPRMTREEFIEGAIKWFHKRGMLPSGASESWYFAARYPKFDWACMPTKLLEATGASQDRMYDVANPFAYLDSYKNRLPNAAALKEEMGSEGDVAHDAYLDVIEESESMFAVWNVVRAGMAHIRKVKQSKKANG